MDKILKFAMLVTVFFGFGVYSVQAFYIGSSWALFVALLMLILFVQEIRILRLESTVDEWEEEDEDDDDDDDESDAPEPDDGPTLIKMRIDSPKERQNDLSEL